MMAEFGAYAVISILGAAVLAACVVAGMAIAQVTVRWITGRTTPCKDCGDWCLPSALQGGACRNCVRKHRRWLTVMGGVV